MVIRSILVQAFCIFVALSFLSACRSSVTHYSWMDDMQFKRIAGIEKMLTSEQKVKFQEQLKQAPLPEVVPYEDKLLIDAYTLWYQKGYAYYFTFDNAIQLNTQFPDPLRAAYGQGWKDGIMVADIDKWKMILKNESK